MTTMLNSFASRLQYGNTGQPKGKQFSLKPFQGVLVHPDGFTIPQSYLNGSYEDLIAYIQEAQFNDPTSRVWCFPSFFGLTETTEAASVQKSPYGNEVSYTENPQSMDVELENKGTEFYKSIRFFEGRQDLRGIFFQEDGFLFESNQDGSVNGCEISMIPKQTTLPTKDAYAKQIVSFQIKDRSFLSDNVNFVQTKTKKEIVSYFKGILNVDHYQPFTGVVKAVESISRYDLYDVYSTELATPNAWKAVDALTGAIKTITSVTANPTYKGWNIVAEGVNIITLVSPTLLSTLGVGSYTAGGYETKESVRLGE